MPDGAGPSIIPATAGQVETPESAGGLKTLLQRLLGQRGEDPAGAIPVQMGPESVISQPERTMIDRIVAFDKKRVDDVAIPRADIVGVEADTTLDALLNTFSTANHSRLPVYRGDLDDPLGMVHIKDVVGLIADLQTPKCDHEGPVLDGMIRKILYVPPSMPVTDLLLRMQASRVHMALVIDEFGGTDGLVTIEDLIELIVGDIRDEHDDAEEFTVSQVAAGRWEADARTPLEAVREATGLNVALEDHDADTLGGLIFSLAGRVPLRGEVISHPAGIEFDIREADARRIRKMGIRCIDTAAPESPATSANPPSATAAE